MPAKITRLTLDYRSCCPKGPQPAQHRFCLAGKREKHEHSRQIGSHLALEALTYPQSRRIETLNGGNEAIEQKNPDHGAAGRRQDHAVQAARAAAQCGSLQRRRRARQRQQGPRLLGADRIEHARRMGWLCDQVVKVGCFAIADFICPTPPRARPSWAAATRS